MAQYSYTAIKKNGETAKGTQEAQDETAAINALAKAGLRPISVKAVSKASSSFSFTNLMGGNKVKSDHLVMFTRQLSAMVSAGVPLMRALSSLQQRSESPALKSILQSVVKDVQSGLPIGDSLAKFPNTFSDVYVNMVRAGEAAGILDDILKRLALQQEKNSSMRKKIKSAMTYPVVLMVITVIAFFGLMIFVIPQIATIIVDLGGPDAQLPVLTQVMLGISSFMINFWYILIPAMIGAIFLVLRYIKTPVGRKNFHRLVLKVPAVKVIIMKVAVARFARTFSALMGAGVPIIEALNVTSHAIGNVVYEEALQKASADVQTGETLSSLIDKNSLFPAIVSQMLSVGEETGQTGEVLVKVADFYEEEVDVAIESVSSIIEPVMIVIMGGAVGLVAASVMGPIANMANTIQ